LAGDFRRIPRELEEAAAIDGMTEFQTFRLVLLPLAGPALAATGILVFIFCWNEFMFALTFMNLHNSRTVTVGVATLSGAFAYEIPWGPAGVVVSALPLNGEIVLAPGVSRGTWSAARHGTFDGVFAGRALGRGHRPDRISRKHGRLRRRVRSTPQIDLGSFPLSARK
jgi:ABC-type spermidine/putrescine transport system permease subunit II